MRMKRRLLVSLVMLLVMSVLGPLYQKTAFAAGIVGTGTAASCTEAALDTALAGGGSVGFNCGSGNVIIPITTTKVISTGTILEGYEKITLQGNRTRRLFIVNSGVTLSIFGVNLSNGKDVAGGAILNNGSLIITTSAISNSTASMGGAIYQSDTGSLIIVNGVFFGNQADDSGGAIYAAPNSTFRIVGSQFTLNGVANGHGSAVTGSGTIQNSTFGSNVAGTGGAGSLGLGTIYADNELSVTGSEFTSNVATSGGGIYISDTVTTAAISYCKFSRNIATGGGGGIYVAGYDHENGVTVNVKDSRFERNRGYTGGGGILVNSGLKSGTYVQTSQFIANTAVDTINGTSGLGGGIGVLSGYLDVDQSTFSRNHARDGGGIGVDVAGRFRIIASTLDANIADGSGGGLFLDRVDVTKGSLDWVENSTFYANKAYLGGGIFISGRPFPTLELVYVTIADNSGNGITSDSTAVVRIRGSIIAFNTGVNCSSVRRDTFVPNTAGSLEFPGNTCGGVEFRDMDPLLGVFGDHGGKTYTIPLLPGSPAIDKIPPFAGSTYHDQRDMFRPADGNGDGYIASDIGAVEMQGPDDN